jgi:hypothetical protein
MDYEEVATVLDVPVGTIRSRLSRGRQALRRLTGAAPEEKAENRVGESQAASRARRCGGEALRSEIAANHERSSRRRARTDRGGEVSLGFPQNHLEPSLG